MCLPCSKEFQHCFQLPLEKCHPFLFFTLCPCIKHPSLINKSLSPRSVVRKKPLGWDVVAIRARGNGSVMEQFPGEQKINQ